MMFWYDHDMSGWGYAGMAIGMVLFWALIIGGIVALVRYASGDQSSRYTPPSEQPDPQHLLDDPFSSDWLMARWRWASWPMACLSAGQPCRSISRFSSAPG